MSYKVLGLVRKAEERVMKVLELVRKAEEQVIKVLGLVRKAEERVIKVLDLFRISKQANGHLWIRSFISVQTRIHFLCPK